MKTKFAAGGDLWRTQSYAPFTTAVQGGLLTAIDVGTQAGPGALLHQGYVYDEFGNTTTITETTTANVLSYDGQSRVTQAFGATFSYQPSGRFDRFVGLTFSYGTGAAAGSYRSPLHGVVSTGAGGVFTYDANGNMVSRKTTSAAPTQTLAWSLANELLSVTTGTTVESYRYDADGQRVYQESKTGGNLTWQQFDYFPHYTVGITTTQAITKTYFFAGQPVAQRVGGKPLTYLHADHLGSTVLTTGVSGSAKYHAYGAQRAGFVNTKHQFTGHEADSGTGLIYMKARYYDPVIGQFISPDTVVPDPNNVYAYNRYMYAYGNPVKYTDPTGYDPLDDAWREEFFSIHGRFPDAHDETLRLFSIAYPDEWSEALFYAESGQLHDLAGIVAYLHDTSRRNWDGLGKALDSMAGWYKDNEAALFSQDVSFLFAGTRGRSQTGDGSYWQSGHYGENLDVFIGRGHLPERYFDRPGNQDNDADFNVHHFAWAFGMGYEVGAAAGRFINMTKEYRDAPLNVDQSDLEMGGLGARLGGALRSDSSMLRSLSSKLYEALGYEP